MCQSKADGGRRCAAHTRPAYQRALTTITAATTPSDQARLVDQHHTALVDHAMTPQGSRELADHIASIEHDYTHEPAATAEEETGRQEHLAALRLLEVQARVRAEVEEQLRRRARYEATGTHAEPPVPDCPPPPDCPRGIDPDWYTNLTPEQQTQLADHGTITLTDAYGDPTEVTPGILDDNADWVYKRGQCLALAVALAEQTGGQVYCQLLEPDPDDPDDGEPSANLAHAYTLLPDGVLLDIQGEHGAPADLPAPEDADGYIVDVAPEPVTFANPRDALTHFAGRVVHQDVHAARPFAATVLAHHRLGTYVGECNYEALEPTDARALLDTNLQRRYMQGDCGILAHHLATQNGWGVLVVGAYDTEEWEGETLYTVDTLNHAYAVRPDGMLVDVTGVHHPDTAIGYRTAFNAIHQYPDAATADEIWNHAQWLDDDDDWDDNYTDEDDTILADHVARLTTIAYATAPPETS